MELPLFNIDDTRQEVEEEPCGHPTLLVIILSDAPVITPDPPWRPVTKGGAEGAEKYKKIKWRETWIPVTSLRNEIDFITDEGVAGLEPELFIGKAQATLLPSRYALHLILQVPHGGQLTCNNDCVTDEVQPDRTAAILAVINSLWMPKVFIAECQGSNSGPPSRSQGTL